MCWTDHTWDIMQKLTLPEINLEPEFKRVWEIIHNCFTAKKYKRFGPADLRILYNENVLGGGKIIRSLLYYEIENTKSSNVLLRFSIHHVKKHF